jgi:hypothetical protein
MTFDADLSTYQLLRWWESVDETKYYVHAVVIVENVFDATIVFLMTMADPAA